MAIGIEAVAEFSHFVTSSVFHRSETEIKNVSRSPEVHLTTKEFFRAEGVYQSLSPAHKEFLSMDLDTLKNPSAVVYDVKGVLKNVDGKL